MASRYKIEEWDVEVGSGTVFVVFVARPFRYFWGGTQWCEIGRESTLADAERLMSRHKHPPRAPRYYTDC